MPRKELVTLHLKESGGVNASSLSDQPAKDAILASAHADCTHHGNAVASPPDLLTEQMRDAAAFSFLPHTVPYSLYLYRPFSAGKRALEIPF